MQEREKFTNFRSNKRAFPHDDAVDDVIVCVKNWTVLQSEPERGEMKKINN